MVLSPRAGRHDPASGLRHPGEGRVISGPQDQGCGAGRCGGGAEERRGGRGTGRAAGGGGRTSCTFPLLSHSDSAEVRRVERETKELSREGSELGQGEPPAGCQKIPAGGSPSVT